MRIEEAKTGRLSQNKNNFYIFVSACCFDNATVDDKHLLDV